VNELYPGTTRERSKRSADGPIKLPPNQLQRSRPAEELSGLRRASSTTKAAPAATSDLFARKLAALPPKHVYIHVCGISPRGSAALPSLPFLAWSRRVGARFGVRELRENLMEMQQGPLFHYASRNLEFHARGRRSATSPAITDAGDPTLEGEFGGELLRRERRQSHLTELGQRMCR